MKLILPILLLTSFPFGIDNPDFKEYDRWLKFYQINEGDFKSECAQDSLDLIWGIYFPVADSYREMLDKFFIFSPDSAHLIDLDSYSLAVERIEGKLVSCGFGVDSKIQIVRVKDNKAA